jgi:glyoxylase-like metal-dependent hydrolase (beta-lactamase superfamily II)
MSLAAVVQPGAGAAEGPSGDWFTASEVAEKVWRIDDHGADNLYLVAGSEKALLIDTGLGVGDIMKVVRTLTDLPLIVVNTHGHPDHAGGNNQFAEVHAHPDDFGLIGFFSTPEQKANMRAQATTGVEVPEDQLFREAEAATDTKLVPVTDGDAFELGGRRLEVISVPGHTKGGICLVEKNLRLLFSGDNNNTLEWMFLEHSMPLETYLGTLQALEARDDFDTLLPGHGGSLDKGFISEQIACLRSILDGTCQDEPYTSFAGTGRLCRHQRASIAYNPENLR